MLKSIQSKFFFARKCKYQIKRKFITELTTKSGERTQMSVFKRKGRFDKIVLYCHGNGEIMTDCFNVLKHLSNRGIAIASFEYPGHGEASGTPCDEGCYENAHAAYEYIRYKMGVDPRNIFVLGYSLGSGVATELAATEEVGGIILQAPFTTAYDIVEYYKSENMVSFPLSIIPSSAVKGVFDSIQNAKKITCRSLVFHGTSDKTVPYEQGVKMFEAIDTSDKELVSIEGGGHCTFQEKMGFANYIDKLATFVNK